MTRAALLAAALLAGCQLTTDFTVNPIAETGEALCVDEADGDFDGLTDCQDWNCLGVIPCCDIPEVLLEDDFAAGPLACDDASCAGASCVAAACGPDDARWHAWPCPFAKVCGGALHLDKTQCFAAGVLSRETASLGPGLIVTTEVEGRPERLGYLETALTLQGPDALPGALDECGSLQAINGFASARVVYADAGLEVVALFRTAEIGRSGVVDPSDGPHEIALAIGRDRRVTYALDGVTFATASVPVPVGETRARVALTGLTESATFGRVRVEAGIRCHDPTSWRPARGDDLESSVTLASLSGSSAFDGDEVYLPALRRSIDGLEMFYTGCFWPSDAPRCSAFGVGIGRAVGDPLRAPMTRDADRNPWLLPGDLTEGGLNQIYPDVAVSVIGSPRAGVVPLGDGAQKSMLALDEAFVPGALALPPSGAGAWDQGVIERPALVDGPDGVRRLYYAARATVSDRTARIGLAISTDGATFTRVGVDPVLTEGPPDAWDGGGVAGPVVVYDASRRLYLMWYEGRDFFGKNRIGYAVSTDGVAWHRFPGNPVITPEALGLSTVGGPAVDLAPDGRMLMLLHGTTVAEPRRRIFALVNEGSVGAPP